MLLYEVLLAVLRLVAVPARLILRIIPASLALLTATVPAFILARSLGVFVATLGWNLRVSIDGCFLLIDLLYFADASLD
jgi:hypothetical protein